jgi:integrase
MGDDAKAVEASMAGKAQKTGKWHDRHDIFNDGKVVIFRSEVRGKINPTWQCYITTASAKGRIRKSTKTTDKAKAISIATNELYKAEGRLQQGLPLNPVRFSDVCFDYLRRLKKQAEQNLTTENNYENQNRVITGSIEPYLGHLYLHQINAGHIQDYQLNRKTKGPNPGNTVKAGTINRDNAYIRSIYEYAMSANLISTIPLIKNYSGGKQRQSFSYEEMVQLRKHLTLWVKSIHEHDAPHVKDYRRLFALYIYVMQYSGIRPGKEMSSLKWEDIEYKSQGKQRYVKMRCITSKQKAPEKQGNYRTVIAMPQLEKHLEEIKQYPNCYNPNGLIFGHPPTTQLADNFIGKPIGTFKKQWQAFLSFAGYDLEDNDERRQLYSIRHYYMEQRLINSDVSLVALADNTGTSPAVILKWYREASAESFATDLSKVITESQ